MGQPGTESHAACTQPRGDSKLDTCQYILMVQEGGDQGHKWPEEGKSPTPIPQAGRNNTGVPLQDGQDRCAVTRTLPTGENIDAALHH